jgi:hypothetical protein
MTGLVSLSVRTTISSRPGSAFRSFAKERTVTGIW